MHIRQAISSAIEAASDDVSIDCIWVGLSAGVDSTVLLHALVQEVANTDLYFSKTKIKAIHIHHGLSNNADEWAEQAKILCTQLSQHYNLVIECIVERVNLDRQSDGLEQAARQARYRVFEKYCQNNDVLLQGHHLDDQIETFFMRAVRGSGLTGLSGIPKQRNVSRDNTCQIIRPLLAIAKNQLMDYAQEHQLTWVEDESNKDSTIDRNWWRNELLPQIWQRYPNKKQALSRTINNIQHEKTLLQRLITEKVGSQSNLPQEEMNVHPALNTIPHFDLALIQKLDQATSLSYLRAWLAQYVDILPSAIQMQSIYVDLIEARIDAEPSFSWGDKSLYRFQGHLFLWHAKSALADSRLSSELNGENRLFIDWNGAEQKYSFGALTYSEINEGIGLKPADYAIKFWQAGDTAKPIGRSTRKMKKWWQDYGVASWARNHWPIIVNKETHEIAAVPGLFICQGYQAEQDGWYLDWKFTN